MALNRKRPYQFSTEVQPVGDLSESPGYPSFTATEATLVGILLGNMVPEKRAEIMRTAWEVGDCRVVLGVHYPSDIEAGRITGFLLAQAMMSSEDFEKEFDPAKSELLANMAP